MRVFCYNKTIMDDTDKTQKEFTKSAQYYRMLFENMLAGFAHCEMIFDQAGKPVDFRYLEVNSMFEKLTGLKNVAGKLVSEVIPGVQVSDPKLFETYGRVALSGQSEQFEIYLEALKTWFLVSVYSIEKGFFTAVFDNITDRKKIEEEHKTKFWFFESLDHVNRAIQEAADIEQMLSSVLERVSMIFDCDRVWFVYPCDPDSASFRVPMEITKPAYPGAKILNVDLPMSPDVAQNMRDALASIGPVAYVAGTEHPVNKITAEQFGVQSQLLIAVHPKIGKPWVFGMHQCSYPRVWTGEEKWLFQEISRRLTDGLTSLLANREIQESEEKYRRIVETTSEGVWLTDKDFVITFVNPRMEDILGYAQNEIIGRTVAGFLVPEEVDAHKLRMEERRKGVAGSYETRFIRKDGEVIVCNISATPVYDAQKQFTGSLGMMADVTKRKQDETDLRKSIDELRNLMDAIPAVVYVLDTERNIVKWNRKAEIASGYSSEELSHKIMFELIPEHERPATISMINDAYGKGYAEVVAHLLRKDGVLVPHRWSGAPLRDEAGNEIGIIGIGWDLTEQIKSEEKIRGYQLLQRVILDTIPDIVWMKDANGVYLAANEAFLVRVGKRREEVIGKTDFDFWPKEYAEKYRADDNAVMQSKMQKRIEETTVDSKGVVISVETIKTPVYDDAGMLLGVTGVARTVEKPSV